MEGSQTPAPAPSDALHGKRPLKVINVKAKIEEIKRKQRGEDPPNESQPEEELEPGATVLHRLFNRRVILHADNTVVKSGKDVTMGETEALKVAAEAGIPVPCSYGAHKTSDGNVHIRMSYIAGEPLEKLWPDMSADQKKDIARQLREIVGKMRSMDPPPNYIGSCDGKEVRELRTMFTHHAPPCSDEKAFNEYLLSGLTEITPSVMRIAIAQRLRTGHRVVFTHGDLAPRNIMVDKEGEITGLVDWEASGWYPEYWEIATFLKRPPAAHPRRCLDWPNYAEDIFSELYHDELVCYWALSRFQKP